MRRAPPRRRQMRATATTVTEHCRTTGRTADHARTTSSNDTRMQTEREGTQREASVGAGCAGAIRHRPQRTFAQRWIRM